MKFNSGQRKKRVFGKVVYLHSIEGYANGSFTVKIIFDEEYHVALLNAKGDYVCMITVNADIIDEIHGVVLGDNDCLVRINRDFDEKSAKVYPYRLLFDKGVIRQIGRDDFSVFANDWYVISDAQQNNKLYDDKHQLIAKQFDEAKVFSTGYALRCGSKWSFFTLSGLSFLTTDDNISFVGDGNFLVKKDDKPVKLCSFDGKILVEKPIESYEEFGNGCFVLAFEDGNKRMYKPDGYAKSIVVENAEFLPDGSFVHYNGKLIGGVYGSDGILDRREIYSFEKAGNYYLFSGEFDTGVLYDMYGNKLGQGYKTIEVNENFVLFEQDGICGLYNQFGRIVNIEKLK